MEETTMGKYYQISEDQLEKLVDEPVNVALAERDVAHTIIEVNNKNYIVAVHKSTYDKFIEYIKIWLTSFARSAHFR